MEVELVEQTQDGLVDDVVDRVRLVVERRHRRADRHTHIREGEHVAQVDRVQRRLSHGQDEPAPLLQHDVGGAADGLSKMPFAIAPRVFVLQGAITMP